MGGGISRPVGLRHAGSIRRERAPAGPRYERNGSIRPAWDRPAAWAGLDKVPPTRTDEELALHSRARDIDVELKAAQMRLADELAGCGRCMKEARVSS